MTGGGACAVCKHQRRKCEPNCELAAYFPANRMNDFRALHLVFGVANLTKLIKANATEAARRRAAETLTWEARWRERDPSEGCYREVSCLRRDNALLRAENAALRRHADQCSFCGAARHASSATTLQHQQQLLHVTGRPPPPHNAGNGSIGGFAGGGYNGVMSSVRAPPQHAQALPATAAAQTLTGGFVAQDERYRVVSVCPAAAAANGGAMARSGATVRGQGGDCREKS
uniref:LOB domain-containing protein n=1 Tax=Leersia perrieri TaxID=77586 RepID=A0A0D9UYW7_9ORYZ